MFKNDTANNSEKCKNKGDDRLKKFYTIIGTFFILLIPLMFLSGIIDDRKDFRDEAVRKIGSAWGHEQIILTPTLSYKLEIKDKKGEIQERKTINLDLENCYTDIQLNTEIRKKGFFKIPVFTADVKQKGNFISDGNIAKKKLIAVFDVSDSVGFQKEPHLKLLNKEYSLQKTSLEFTQPTEVNKIPFEIDYKLRGLNTIKVGVGGNNNNLKIKGNWSAPSFNGNFLPTSKTVEKDRFAAEWNVPKIATGSLEIPTANVSLLIPVDNYRMTDRAMKYAFLFLTLTFMTFFIFEIVSKEKHKIHPLQYCQLGMATQIFYLLLLSISEITSFAIAYVTASLMTISMIAVYTYFVITKKAGKNFTAIITSLLLALYGLLYVLLSLQDYALIIGSIGLFLIIALVMYTTRNIEWYNNTNE